MRNYTYILSIGENMSEFYLTQNTLHIYGEKFATPSNGTHKAAQCGNMVSF
jgi:hypothetical protein